MGDKIRIIGAGPSGLATAIILAKNGKKVEVFEQRPNVGFRFNEDYQGLENWSVEKEVITELTDVGLELNFFCKPISGIRIYNTSLKPIEVSSSRTLLYLIKRGCGKDTLDIGLREQALASGVRILYNQKLSSNKANIIASGPRGVSAVAAGITFPIDYTDLVYATVGDELSPKGYTYFLIADGKATMATVLFADFKLASRYLDKTIKTYSKLLNININEYRRWGGHVYFNIPQTAIKGKQLVVGEAAGFQDILFGFGIRTAILSGALAAKSILSGKSYDDLWRKRILPTMNATRFSRLLYGHLGKGFYNFLWLMAGRSRKPEKIMRWLYSWGNIR